MFEFLSYAAARRARGARAGLGWPAASCSATGVLRGAVLRAAPVLPEAVLTAAAFGAGARRWAGALAFLVGAGCAAITGECSVAVAEIADVSRRNSS